jgi:hypothetical protein
MPAEERSNLCTWCIADMQYPSAAVFIRITSTMDPDRVQRYIDGQSRHILSVIEEAIALDEQVELNGHTLTWPITTWHGDPVCRFHLPPLVQQAQIQTVRMAQWGPRR